MPMMDNHRPGDAVSGMASPPGGMARRILILGGTTEARALAARLAGRCDLEVTLSLAGRTAFPVAQPVPVRTGGFGGAAGLAEHLRAARVEVLLDATHPYAAAISANAAEAARATGIPLLALRRPPWLPQPGDCWTQVDSAAAAAAALGPVPRRVFLALGRQEARAFEAAPHHIYLIRSVDPILPPLTVPRADTILARGPFEEAAECAMLQEHRIEVLVAKNSGGTATYGKVAAARSLGLPMILLRRPVLPEVPAVETVEAALGWLDHAPTLRGV
jgi:precorrin-6A/cobalt-precorrin-6A reductase